MIFLTEHKYYRKNEKILIDNVYYGNTDRVCRDTGY